MLRNKNKPENLTNYINALSGIETIATHLIAHAFQKLGIDTINENETTNVSLPIDSNKEALFRACISVLDKAGLLIDKDQGQEARLKTEDIMSMKELAALKAGLIDTCPAIDAHIQLLLQCAKSLPAVIAGKIDGLQVLFPRGRSELVANTYRGNALQDELNQQVARQVVAELRSIGGSGRSVPRVLEIGAGTCATTRTVMKEMVQIGTEAELCVSDIALALVKDAEENFSEQYPFTSFTVLDIEEQNDEKITAKGQFDIIYAANVLHATSSIRPVIDNIVKLLRPGGVLIINELVAFSVFATITFGLTEGWWLFDDDERIAFSPLIEASKWEQLLKDSGFELVSHYFPSYEGNCYFRQAVISSRLGNNN